MTLATESCDFRRCVRSGLCGAARDFARASVIRCEWLAKPSHTSRLQAAIQCAAGIGEAAKGVRDQAGAENERFKEAAKCQQHGIAS
jgi:hypothetical protein